MNNNIQFPTCLPCGSFDLMRSANCGQAFRFKQQGDLCFGVIDQTPLFAYQKGENLYLSCPKDMGDYFTRYFSIDRDYAVMEEILAKDPQTAPCLEYSRGIRVFRQDPFEALISFIISANNNVKRISGIIERLCEKYGQKSVHYGREYNTFPSPKALAQASEQDLMDLGTGYRAPYIIKSAQKIHQGYNLFMLSEIGFESAKKELLSFSGVGPKVAECVMLFSLGYDRAFPVDVWVNRIVEYLYPGEQGEAAARAACEQFGEYAGAAQQYMFHYARIVGLGTKKMENKK